MGKNSPTAPELDQNQGGTKPQTLEAEKQIIAQKIDQFLQQPDTTTAHPFFGKLTRNDWARLSYVHIDYHLKQFGA